MQSLLLFFVRPVDHNEYPNGNTMSTADDDRSAGAFGSGQY